MKPNETKSNDVKPQSIQEDLDLIQELKIPEPQGDLADRAEIEIEQEMEELIWRVRQKIKNGVDIENKTH